MFNWKKNRLFQALNQQSHDSKSQITTDRPGSILYSECDYLERLHKLDLLPINSKFLFTDLLLFHRIVNCDIQINLPGHITKVRPSSNHQACTRSNTITISDDLMFKSSEWCNVAAVSNSFFLPFLYSMELVAFRY